MEKECYRTHNAFLFRLYVPWQCVLEHVPVFRMTLDIHCKECAAFLLVLEVHALSADVSVVSFTHYLHTAFIADYWDFPFFRFLRHRVRVLPLQTFVSVSTLLALQSISSHAITIGCSFDVF